jgi:epoxyqueuosine reductase
MGNRIYGCDDCLAICPWNKFAVATREAKLAARPEIEAARLSTLLQLDDPAFRKLFSASPVKRIGRDRFMRNVLIAAGNSGETTLVPYVKALLDDGSALVRAMTVWALKQLDPQEFECERRKRQGSEQDETVVREWQMAAA